MTASIGMAHSKVDLAIDAQAAIALVFIPIYATIPTIVAFCIGLMLEWLMRKRSASSS